jgi:WD40 repeat protein
MSEKRSLRPLQRSRRAAPQPFHGAKPPTNRDLMSRDSGKPRSLSPAPIIAALLLVLLAAGSLFTFSLSTPAASENPDGGPEVTAGVTVDGTIAFGRGGSIWSVSGSGLRQLTTSTTDSDLAWSTDGVWLYAIRHRIEVGGRLLGSGSVQTYEMKVPSLLRLSAYGGGEEEIFDGLILGSRPALNWSGFMYGPALTSDGRIAVATDYRGRSLGTAVVVRILSSDGSSISTPPLPYIAPFGHQDPVWSPDGKAIYYVQNGLSEGSSSSRIIRYNIAKKSTTRIGDKGLVQPAISPDGRWIAATRMSARGTDVVIMNSTTGEVMLEITRTGKSWAPAWSPNGAQLAYLSANGSQASLNLASFSVAPSGLPNPPVIVSPLRDPVDPNVRPAWGSLNTAPVTESPAP